VDQNTPKSACHDGVWRILIYLVPAAGLALGLLLLMKGIAQPWNGFGDPDGALFSSIARNYLQFGVFNLKFGQLATFEAITQPGGTYYLHHPPLLPLSIAASFSLFGEAEVYARLVSVLATLGTAGLLFIILREAVNVRTGLLGAFFFLTYPSTVVFGRKPGYEALTLFFVVLAVWLYQNYRNQPGLGRMLLLLASLAAGAASDWAAYLLPPVMILHYVFTHKARPWDWPLLAGLVLVPAVTLAAFLFGIYQVDKASVLDLIHQGLAYTGLFSAHGEIAKTMIEAKITFTGKEYFFRLIKNFDTAFGLVSALLAFLGLVLIQRHKKAKWSAFALSFVALGTFVVFWRSLFFHLWWLHLLTAPLAILGAVAVNGMLELLEPGKPNIRDAARAGIVAAVALPVMLGMLYNVWQLANQQIRILPHDQLEKPDFIPLLGRAILGATSMGDRILTNLAPVTSETNPYARVLPYYSRRVIVPAVSTPDQVLAQISEARGQPDAGFYFLFGPGTKMSHAGNALLTWLNQHATARWLTVQGQSFQLFKLDRGLGT
jgi:4-amino-4-deoxy-L-arabinose transferase-like glycosyltransferase